jgi:Ca-activated chloride channel family protein
MHFEAPLWLLALAAVPVAMVLYATTERTGTRRRAAFAAPGLLPSVVPRRAGWRRHIAPLLYALALAALIVALARPTTTVAVPVERASVLLLFDHSGSMASKDVAPSRLVAARNAGQRFLGKVPKGVKVGVLAFNQRAGLLQSPTTDRTAAQTALNGIVPAGSTATGDALALAVRALRPKLGPGQKPAPAAIVLLSDGKSVRGRDPVDAARTAKRAGIRIYTVALGTPAGTIPLQHKDGRVTTEPVPPDPATMRAVASVSGGQAYTAEDAGKLAQVYDKLGSQISHRKEQRQITAGVAGAALLLVIAAAGASLTWFGRVP